MNKNKLFLFIFSFIIIGIYAFVNYYLTSLSENPTNISEYINKELENKYSSLLDSQNLSYNRQVLGCKVIERNIYNFFDEIIINKGKSAGIEKGMAVINSKGLVGVVSKSLDNLSYVDLITSGDLAISIKVNNSYGILKNGHITNIVNYSEIENGTPIYTSGLTKIGEGIKVGEVRNVSLDKYQLEKIIDVDMLPLDNLNFVYVITGD